MNTIWHPYSNDKIEGLLSSMEVRKSTTPAPAFSIASDLESLETWLKTPKLENVQCCGGCKGGRD